MEYIYNELKINPNSIDKKWIIYTVMFGILAISIIIFACINSMGICPKLLCCMCRPKNNSRWINIMATLFIFTNALLMAYYIWF